ncbi:MAG: DUF1998 domain-containing protein [Myxococcota bacterium]|nr:DUF1998 domain-containing protein [Myxococcota bacterium]
MLGARSTTLSSVAVGHLFTTPLNTDRKLLTFSDSVQDAAHRAGFFGARTYRFALRSAVLAAVPQEGSIPLASLGEAVWTHWTSETGWMGDSRASVQAELTARLLPVDLHWLPVDLHWLPSVADWHSRLDELVKRARQAEQSGESAAMDVPEPSPQLVIDVKDRLTWECARELGVASRIGRTLEQSGSLSVHPNEARFGAAVGDIAALLRGKLGLSSEAEIGAVARCVAGLLHRLRLRGGIYDRLLEGYVINAGEGFFLSKQKAPLLSPFPKESSRPIFLTNAPKPRRFESVTATSKQTWACDWLVRSLGIVRDAGLASHVYAVIVPELARHGLLISRTTDERGAIPGTKATAWGLAPEALEVTRAHVFRRCSACGYELAAAPGVATDPLGHPCLRFRCPGSFGEVVVAASTEDPSDLPIASYYKRFYERAQLGRLWSREHTGLLARGPREALELEFKQRPRPDSPNLLSCTPTLEMGIDIGDLSATLLCSVPPRSSNYVQRVGRAGRKTGNALILAFAASRPHDLHFFQDPLQAMAGTIHPPGCYLSAPEVLKRQALAFVFDSYARSGGTLPGRVQDLWRVGEKKRFPDPVLEFLAPRRETLQRDFVEMFRGALKEHAKGRVATFFAPTAEGLSPIEATLTRVSREVRERRDELRKAAQGLDERAKKLQNDEAEAKKVLDIEDERRRIGDERAFVHHQLRALSERDLFGWLTEEGCLPNYAFPERGVKLDAYIRRESVNSEPEHHEWVRAPSAALTELAPFNTFYASSRRVTIDGIEMRREAKFLDWRFCGRCQHAEIAKAVEDGTASPVCPSCGDASFADVGRRRTVVPLAKVFAVTRHRDAVLGDDGDDRERGFYEKATLFEPQAKAREAWSNETAGFGFELQTELVMRQLNLGPRNDRSSTGKMMLAGHEVPDVRFVLCEECGQAHVPERGRQQRAPREKHRGWCSSRKKPEDKQRFREVHLLRELRSEALRVVLPIAAGEDVASDRVNLRAALRLGLRHFYGGEPDFLDVLGYDEPLPGNEGRRNYLVVMDRVPGGTGLLAELALDKGASLEKALRHSEAALRECSCRARVPEVKACYQCLYVYREQSDLPVLERSRALELVQRVLGAFGALTSVDTIGTMTQSQVLESELEHRFVLALRERVREGGGSFEELEDGLWKLRVGARGWLMRAQVTLDADRVAVPCRADFVLYPEGENDGADESIRPIAVFTDGLAYHVCPTDDRARLGDDARKRSGVSSGGQMLTWSLTWKDVVSPDSPPMPRWLGDGTVFADLQGMLFALDQKQPSEEKLAPLLRVLDSDPVRGLVAVLGSPSRLDLLGRIAAFVLLARGRRNARASLDAAQKRWRTEGDVRALEGFGTEGDTTARDLTLGEHAGLLIDVPAAQIGALVQSAGGLRVTVRIDDATAQRVKPSFEASWRHWLRAWNLLQTIPDAALTTSDAIVGGDPLEIEESVPVLMATAPAASAPVAKIDNDDPRMAALREVQDAKAREVIARLLAKHPGLAAPDVPLELRRPRFKVEDDLELGWFDAKVAAYLDHQRAAAEALVAMGWTTFAIERGLDVAALERALGLGDRKDRID